jgi:hypothetical protein
MFESHNSVEVGQLRAWHYDDVNCWPLFLVVEVQLERNKNGTNTSYVRILEDGTVRTLRLGDVSAFSIDSSRMEGQAWSK